MTRNVPVFEKLNSLIGLRPTNVVCLRSHLFFVLGLVGLSLNFGQKKEADGR